MAAPVKLVLFVRHRMPLRAVIGVLLGNVNKAIFIQLALLITRQLCSLGLGNRLRRVGHVMLVAWAGLWLGNAVNIARLGGGFIFVVWIGLLGLLFLCTLLRAARGWSTVGSPRKAAEADVAS